MESLKIGVSRVTMALTMLLALLVSCGSHKNVESSSSRVVSGSHFEKVYAMSQLVALSSLSADSITLTLSADSIRTHGGDIVYKPAISSKLASPSAEVASASFSSAVAVDSSAVDSSAVESSHAVSKPTSFPRSLLLLLLVIPIVMVALKCRDIFRT